MTDKKEEEKIKALFLKERTILEDSNEARLLYDQSRFGTILEDSKLQISLIETMYLLEKGKIQLFDSKQKEIPTEKFMKKAEALEPNFYVRYSIFKDLRNRGYIVKTAMKFGADFRVYDRGVKPGEDHAKWVVFPVHETSSLTWHEFSAKNRVAHSTRKRLLIGCVDEEGDVTYWEIRWLRP
ncbi:tRNA-intron lyase [Candidatus Woesearchaeota archaeon]|nr:tRNA-intron lyase [Candidatus Woesearchaeota archaeon]